MKIQTLKSVKLRYFPACIIFTFPDKTIHIQIPEIQSKVIPVANILEKLQFTYPDLNLSKPQQSKISTLLSTLRNIYTRYNPCVLFQKISIFEPHLLPITNCVLSRDGQFFVTGSYDRTSVITRPSTKSTQSLVGHSNVVYATTFNYPYNDSIITASFDTTAKIWDANSAKCTTTLLNFHTKEVVSVEVDAHRAVTGSLDSTAGIWDTRTGILTNIIKHSGEVIDVKISGDGLYVASGSFDSTIQIFDVRANKILHKLLGHRSEISSIKFDYTNRKVLSGSMDFTAKLWCLETGSCLNTFLNHTAEVLDVSFDLSDKIVTVSADCTGNVYSLEDYRHLAVLKGHLGEISKTCFDSHGGRILTGSSDNTVKIWNSTTGECIQTLQEHNDEIIACSFDYYGEHIMSGLFINF